MAKEEWTDTHQELFMKLLDCKRMANYLSPPGTPSRHPVRKAFLALENIIEELHDTKVR